ncbi:MAG: M23 family metallopeptidase [Chloroflexi bacterium]|nr:M23 family metallopeptidase [Chloroflexota bacterium]
MPRPLFDSEYIFGLHDAGGEQLMLDAGRPGWIVFTEAVGHDPNDFGGTDYTAYSNRNLGVMCRINNGYYPDGTIPHSSQYANFARRCANFVARTPGCKIWIIGNEMNYALERPSVAAQRSLSTVPPLFQETSPSTNSPLAKVGQLAQTIWSNLTGRGELADNGTVVAPTASPLADSARSNVLAANDPYGRGLPERLDALRPNLRLAGADARIMAAAVDNTEAVTPDLYARCYRLCRDAIHAVPGHADDQVLMGAVAPWNNQTTYAGNANGDWVQYFADILTLLGPTACDGFTLHTYTHQANPDLITDETRMDPPFQNRHYQFRAYMDFMQAVPASMRQLPVYITEANQDVPWLEQNISWVQRAYGEIDWWNRQAGNQQIRALVLYRWPSNIDRWGIAGKGAVIEDLRLALQNEYRWRAPVVSPTLFHQGDLLETQDVVNIRRSPGYVGKPADDVLLAAPLQSRLRVLSDSARVTDGLTWWNVQTQGINPTITGWAAQTSPAGVSLLLITKEPTMPPGNASFAIGDQVRVIATARLRRTPGITNKPANDVITQIAADSLYTIAGGPTAADNLTWWRIKGPTIDGWMAQVAPDGQVILTSANRAVPAASFQLGDAVATLDVVRLRTTPGYVGKPASDVVANIALGAQGKVLDGPRNVDNLIWWQIETSANGRVVRGWMAEVGLDGATLLQRVNAPSPPPAPALAKGDLVVTTDILRVRRSPGFSNKPADDVLAQFEARFTLNIVDGPQNADNLPWWRVGGITSTVGEVVGWVAQISPDGQVLIAPAPKLPGTNIPDKASGSYLGAPFQGKFGIAQLWGENPQTYRQITYDGVPLKGHNGIDFLTPVGTPLLAVDAGVVTDAVLNDPTGFGNYIKMTHSWGESIYAHMDSLGVQQGQSLPRGAVIGRSGSTGFVDGPHLHFAIRLNPYSRTDGWGGFSDPLPYMNPSDVQLPGYVQGVAPQASVARGAVQAQVTSARRPGYAPDRPGIRRP